MLPAFVLFLREGLEASLIVSILLASLHQLGQTHHARAVWTGVALAILGAAAGGSIIYFTVREYDDTIFQKAFETITYLVAVAVLTTVTFWMQRHSRSLKREIAAQATAAGSGFALGLLAFTTVGREAVESAFFTLAFAFQTNGMLLLLGATLGILASVGLCILIYRMGYRLDYRLFFRVMGVLLLFFAAGLLGNAVQNMQELGWMRLGTTTLWDTSRLLSEENPVGDLLHGTLGYAQAPSILQAIAYIGFLTIAGGLFWRITRRTPLPQSSGATAPTGASRQTA